MLRKGAEGGRGNLTLLLFDKGESGNPRRKEESMTSPEGEKKV